MSFLLFPMVRVDAGLLVLLCWSYPLDPLSYQILMTETEMVRETSVAFNQLTQPQSERISVAVVKASHLYFCSIISFDNNTKPQGINTGALQFQIGIRFFYSSMSNMTSAWINNNNNKTKTDNVCIWWHLHLHICFRKLGWILQGKRTDIFMTLFGYFRKGDKRIF
jgi:hypothetical protein